MRAIRDIEKMQECCPDAEQAPQDKVAQVIARRHGGPGGVQPAPRPHQGEHGVDHPGQADSGLPGDQDFAPPTDCCRTDNEGEVDEWAKSTLQDTPQLIQPDHIEQQMEWAAMNEDLREQAPGGGAGTFGEAEVANPIPESPLFSTWYEVGCRHQDRKREEQVGQDGDLRDRSGPLRLLRKIPGVRHRVVPN